VNVFYVGLGMWGAWKLWRYSGAQAAVAVLIVYLIVRTAFLTTMETPEPRYVLVCFPALIALGAQMMWRERVNDRKDSEKDKPAPPSAGGQT
jgi:anti-sigma-K factor RskA